MCCVYLFLFLSIGTKHFYYSTSINLFRSLDDSQEGVAHQETLASLQEKFSREFSELYLKLADSAQQQMNYAVAYKYLHLTESAVAKVKKL